MTDEELERLAPGDVIRSRAGSERTVVDVHRKKGKIWVSLPIMRCSWTERCYTVLDQTQLRFGFTLTRKKRQFKRTKIGRKVFHDCTTREQTCDCCEVRGGKFQ